MSAGRNTGQPVGSGTPSAFGSSACKRPLNNSVSVPAPERGPALAKPRLLGKDPVDQIPATDMAAGKKPGKEQAPARRRGRLRGFAKVSAKGEQGMLARRAWLCSSWHGYGAEPASDRSPVRLSRECVETECRSEELSAHATGEPQRARESRGSHPPLQQDGAARRCAAGVAASTPVYQ